MSGTAWADKRQDRIYVHTQASSGVAFGELLAACRAVPGGRFTRGQPGDPSYWHYPLSLDTCHALRRAFGDALRVHDTLAAWYRVAAQQANAQQVVARATDSPLPRLTAAYPQFAAWLRGYQRAGARWMMQGYRQAGLNADKPGVGKTPETLAALIEAQVAGPVLVLCPKASVRLVWAREVSRHLPDVPLYVCEGTRQRREQVLAEFARDVAEEPTRLRLVIGVAEMLRVELGPPCLTRNGTTVRGMCPRGAHHAAEHTPAPVPEKKWVPVGFSYPQLFDQALLGGGWATIILDESHKLLGSLTVVKGNLMGKGLSYLPERSGAMRYALSGTPFGKAGRVEGLFGTLHWLWPDEFTSYWKWIGQRFDVEEKVISYRTGQTAKKIIGLKGLSPTATLEEEAAAYEALLQSLGPRLLRRTKEETLATLPPKTYTEVLCAMIPAQARQYRQLAEIGEVATPGGPLLVNGALPLLTRSRQLANGCVTMDGETLRFTGEGGKVDRLWEALEARGILEGVLGEKLIVASAFNGFLDGIAERLRGEGVGFLQYDGRLSPKDREAVVDAWQAGPLSADCRVLLLNASAGGVSITLDMADEMHILDEPADPGSAEQLEDRIHRASRNHRVAIFYYRTEGTVDFARAHNVEYRRRLQHAILDGPRGVAYARELIVDALTVTDPGVEE